VRTRTILTLSLLSFLALAHDCPTRQRSDEQQVSKPESPASMSPAVAPSAAAPAPAESKEATDPFRGTVRPVLLSRCAPCHEPGGKMYEKLPFDDGKVVASHSEGILRRLKGDDRAALERWLAGLAPRDEER